MGLCQWGLGRKSAVGYSPPLSAFIATFSATCRNCGKEHYMTRPGKEKGPAYPGDR